MTDERVASKRDDKETTNQLSINQRYGRYFKNKPLLPLKIGLGVSCLAVTSFGLALEDSSSSSDSILFLGCMISAAIMVHLFASQLFKENDNKN